MKLSISNIAWSKENDEKMYKLLNEMGYDGIEIAPTRIFPEEPYDNITKAREYANRIKREYGLVISSIQSIWYGKNERIWGSEEERAELINYSKKAINFASVMGCGNLVFGCPRNRCIPENGNIQIAIDFFGELAEYAIINNTCLALEANPTIYDTNFINSTIDAVNFVKTVNSDGFKMNVDFGTMIENNEEMDVLNAGASLINHVHISEPMLTPIKKRHEHEKLSIFLDNNFYEKFVSIEMGMINDIDQLISILNYVKSVF